MPRCQRNDQLAMDDRSRAPGDDQTIVGALPERCYGAFDLARIPHVDRAQLYAKRWRRALECAELGGPGSYRRFSKDRHTRYARGDLLEQLEPFAGYAIRSW
jgi:hypothetical protein